MRGSCIRSLIEAGRLILFVSESDYLTPVLVYSDLKTELKYSSRLFSRQTSKLNSWISLYLIILSSKAESGNLLIVYKADERVLESSIACRRYATRSLTMYICCSRQGESSKTSIEVELDVSSSNQSCKSSCFLDRDWLLDRLKLDPYRWFCILFLRTESNC